MRHFEEYEIEHLLNATGSWFLRLRCRLHLKNCEICRQRRERLLEENFFGQKVREAVRRMEQFRSAPEEKTFAGKSK